MIPAVGAVAAAAPSAGPTAVGATSPLSTSTAVTDPTAPTDAASGFGQLVANGLEQVSQLEFTADAAIQDLATGGPTSIEDVMIATSQAQLGLDLLSRVRDRALEAYQEIMRMPL